MPVRNLAETFSLPLRSTEPAQAPVAEFGPADDPDLHIRPGEDVIAFFDRVAPKVARAQARAAVAGDGKAARWLLERSSAVRDTLSVPLDVTPEDLSDVEGVARTMRNVTVMALRGQLGLTEARRATDLVKESSESMFADAISSMRDALDRARRLGVSHSLTAITAEVVSGGAVTAEEVDGGLLLPVADPAPAEIGTPLRPAWGRFQGASTP